jgi:hypothetical protein
MKCFTRESSPRLPADLDYASVRGCRSKQSKNSTSSGRTLGQAAPHIRHNACRDISSWCISNVASEPVRAGPPPTGSRGRAIESDPTLFRQGSPIIWSCPVSVDQLANYLGLVKWNRAHNLPGFGRKQTGKSSCARQPCCRGPSLRRERRCRSGAGLPGIPIAIARPGRSGTARFHHKKAAFLKQVAAELGLVNARRDERVESYRPRVIPDRRFARFF